MLARSMGGRVSWPMAAGEPRSANHHHPPDRRASPSNPMSAFLRGNSRRGRRASAVNRPLIRHERDSCTSLHRHAINRESEPTRVKARDALGRVRGDHRPDSDVDIRLYLDRLEADQATTQWWCKQNDIDFVELKARLPGPLAIHREQWDGADSAIAEGAKNPVLTVRKPICVFTPPKPPGA
jgi:hypothetical protein